MRSTYQVQKREDTVGQPRKSQQNIDPRAKCGYCDNTGHGKSASLGIRRKVCPAFNVTCKECGRKGHYDHVCRNKRAKGNFTSTGDTEGAVFDTLCSIQGFNDDTRHIQLAHHVFNDLLNRWERPNSDPQHPVSFSLTCHAYRTFGISLPKMLLVVTEAL